MRIYPAIDLYAGNCVRLQQGCYAKQTIYSSDPLEVALGFQQQGGQFLHVVDLEGARAGALQQWPLIESLLQNTQLKIQVGGGIRNNIIIEKLLAAGADRVVLGSIAVTDSLQVCKWLNTYGADKIVLAFDIRLVNQIPYVAISGWQQQSNVTLWEILNIYKEQARYILCTDISRDGVLSGPNIDLYEQCLKQFPELAFIVSGGIRSEKDINIFEQHSKIHGIVIGTALYEQKILLESLVC